MDLSAFDKYVFQTLEVPQLSIDNGSGGSSTTMRSGIDFPIPDALHIDTVLIVNGDVIGYFFDGGSDVRFEAATIQGLTDIFTTAETDYVRVIDSEFVGPLYVNTNEDACRLHEYAPKLSVDRVTDIRNQVQNGIDVDRHRRDLCQYFRPGRIADSASLSRL